MGQWVHVPDGHTVFITPSPIYPSVGGPDELTDVLDHWAETHTGSCTVIDMIDNDQAWGERDKPPFRQTIHARPSKPESTRGRTKLLAMR